MQAHTDLCLFSLDVLLLATFRGYSTILERYARASLWAMFYVSRDTEKGYKMAKNSRRGSNKGRACGIAAAVITAPVPVQPEHCASSASPDLCGRVLPWGNQLT